MNELVEAMWQAIVSTTGIVVRTTDRTRLTSQFYRARRQVPEFEELTIKTMPGSATEMCIIRKDNLNG